jgi:hypothetical protein
MVVLGIPLVVGYFTAMPILIAEAPNVDATSSAVGVLGV